MRTHRDPEGHDHPWSRAWLHRQSVLVLLLGLSLTALFTPRWPAVVALVGAATSIGMTSTVEIALRRRDDALRQAQDLAVKNAALDTALEERRRAEAAALAVEAELRQTQRLESVGLLAGGVAHDFNNLLAVILSYADLLEAQLDGPVDPARARADLEEIRGAAHRGADLTRRLLEFSQQQPDDVGAVELSSVITGLSRLLERTIGEDINLRTELEDDGCTARLDARSLEQAVLNLVLNARDAVAPGGTITISTECVDVGEDDAVRRAGLEPGRYIRLRVADDGSGMPEEVLRRSFDPFFTTKGRAHGTGLGLATVYGMVQSSGGHVSIESEVGVGTTVTLLLPAADAAPTPSDAAPAGAPIERVSARVLLVEDEAAVRAAQSRMLAAAGYVVREAGDGQAALDAYASDIDVLVTDLVMPGALTGADVAQTLRSGRPDLPVLFVTGYGADLLEERGIEIDGASSALLAKPFTEEQLLTAVARAVAGSRA